MRIGFLLALVLAGCDTSPPRTGTKSAALAADTAVLTALDNDSRRAVSRSPVPVLVPKRKELLAVGKVMAEENWYAFHASHDGLTVHVSASKIVHKHDEIPPTKGKSTIRGVPGFLTKNESIWSASWREYGYYYSLDVECGEPTDARCNDDALVLSLTRDLVYVGGAQ
jgi:hypothetical protein